MSDPSIKGVKQSPSRPSSRRSSTSSKQRSDATKGPASKPLAKHKTVKKAPARKVSQSDTPVSSKSKAAKSTPRAGASTKKPAVKGRAATKKTRPAVKTPVRETKTAKAVRVEARAEPHVEPKTATPRSSSAKHQRTVPAKSPAVKTPAPQPARHPGLDESAALQAFEQAYREFSRGKFSEARELFRALLSKHSGGSDVVARARTYLTITESRLKIDLTLPKDADSLYDRGVIELNRGQFVAAQEMFERALSSEPGGAHIHYGLAATRARLGAIESALGSLLRAIDLQPTLRLRAQHDIDLISLRNEPEFDRLVSTHRS